MLFANSELMGTFKGFNEKGLEFAQKTRFGFAISIISVPGDSTRFSTAGPSVRAKIQTI